MDDEPASKASEAEHNLPTVFRWHEGRLVRLAAIYLLVEVVLLGALVGLAGEPSTGFQLLVLPALAMMFGQTVLLAGWFAWGDGLWLLRLALLVGATLAVNSGFYLVAPSYPLGTFLIFALVQALLTAVPLLIARWRGWACRLESESVSDRRPWQYSLAQILILTTIIAITLRLLLLVPWEDFTDRVAALAILALATTAIGWLAWPVMLSFRALAAYPAVLLGSGIVGIVLALSVPRDTGEGIVLAGVQGALMAVCLSVVRSAGYRLTRR